MGFENITVNPVDDEEEGAGATEISPVDKVTVADDEPAAFVAVTVKVVDAIDAEGLPEIIPVLVEKFNPLGTAGVIE